MGIARRDDAFERRLAVVGTATLLDMRDELVAPLLDVARDWIDGEVAERAQRLPEDARADRLQQLDVSQLAVAALELLEQLHHPARALAARRAFPARLVHVELRRAQR